MLRALRMPTEHRACEWHVTSGVQTQIITHICVHDMTVIILDALYLLISSSPAFHKVLLSPFQK